MSMYTELDTLGSALENLSNHWFKRWFLPSGLLKAFEKFVDLYPNNSVAICIAFEKTWFFQRWFFACLSSFKKSVTMDGYRLMNAFDLPNKDKLSDEATKRIKNYLLFPVVNGLETLSQAGLLSGERKEANRKALIKHAGSLYRSSALDILSDAGLLKGDRAEDNVDALVQHRDKENVRDLIKSYKETLLKGKAAQANFVALVQCKAPWSLLIALKRLSEPALLPDLQSHFNQMNQYSAILFERHQSISAWAKIGASPFTQENFDAIMEICANHEGSPEQGAAAFLTYVNEIFCDKPIPTPPENLDSKFLRPRPADFERATTAELKMGPAV